MSGGNKFAIIVDALKLHYNITQQRIAEEVDCLPGAISKWKNIFPGDAKGEKRITEKLDLLLKAFPEYLIKKDNEITVKVKKAKKKKIAQSLPKVFSHKKAPNFAKIFEEIKGESNVWILDTWIPQFNDDRRVHFLDYLDKFKTLRVLILHPDSWIVYYRSKALKKDVESVRKAMWLNVEFLQSLKSNTDRPDRIEFNFYNQNPGINAIILDDKIYYGNFLATNYSQNNFFHEISGRNNLIADQIRSNFDKLWTISTEFTSPPPLGGINSFKPKKWKKKNLEYIYERLGGKYILYNLDEDNEAPFQISGLEIESESKTSILSYNQRNGQNFSSPELNIELVKNDQLAMWFNDDSFSFHLFANIKELQQPDYFPILYLHFDSKGEAKAATGILVRTKKDIIPQRLAVDTDVIEGEIKELLLHYQPILLNTNLVSNKIRKLTINRGAYFDVLTEYVGDWFVYYHERYSREHNELNRNRWIGAVAKSTLSIRRNDNSGELVCEFESLKFPKYTGTIEYEKFVNTSYLNFQLYNENRKRSLNFTFYKGTETNLKERLHGVYSIIYAEEPNLGCGTVILARSKPHEAFIPSSIDPLKVNNDDSDLFGIVHKLIARDENSILLSGDRQKVDKTPFPFVGTYRLYSYGRKEENNEKCITVTALEITNTSYVRFQGEHNDYYADGHAFTSHENLYIILQNLHTGRMGYFIFNVGKQTPKENIHFAGIFNGLTFGNNLPVGNRVIIEYSKDVYEEIPKRKIILNTTEYFNISEGIRRLLTGRVKNMIGFLREKEPLSYERYLVKHAEQEIDFGIVFFENAIYKLSHNDTEKEIVKMLRRAVEHGFLDFARYEEEVKKHENYNLIQDHPDIIFVEKQLDLIGDNR